MVGKNKPFIAYTHSYICVIFEYLTVIIFQQGKYSRISTSYLALIWVYCVHMQFSQKGKKTWNQNFLIKWM